MNMNNAEHFRDAERSYMSSDWEDAVVGFKRVVHRDPNNLLARLRIGLALTQQGKYEQAIEEYNEILKIDPDYSDAHYNLGWVYYHELQNIPEAIKHWQELVRLKPEGIVGRRWLNEALAKQPAR